METKTVVEMQHRLSQLLQSRRQADLTLRTAGELDAIQNHGLEGWNDYLRNQEKKRKGVR